MNPSGALPTTTKGGPDEDRPFLCASTAPEPEVRFRREFPSNISWPARSRIVSYSCGNVLTPGGPSAVNRNAVAIAAVVVAAGVALVWFLLPPPDKILRQGREAMNQKDYDLAVKCFDEA